MKVIIFLILFTTISISFTIIKNHNELMEMKSKKIVNIDTVKVTPKERITVQVTITMYNPTSDQCDSTPFITADNSRINPKKASEHKWVAMSRNLLSRWGGKFKYGDSIKIKGTSHKDGIYIIRDTMNPRYINWVDILETTGTPAYKFNKITIEKVI